MNKIVIDLITLVDITKTDIIRTGIGQDLQRNQQRNFETVLQILSLRTQPYIVSGPYKHLLSEDIVKQYFGEFYKGHQNIWNLQFTADYPEAYSLSNGDLNGLYNDFKEIPIITGLEETARFILPIFYTEGAIKNIHFIQLQR